MAADVGAGGVDLADLLGGNAAARAARRARTHEVRREEAPPPPPPAASWRDPYAYEPYVDDLAEDISDRNAGDFVADYADNTYDDANNDYDDEVPLPARTAPVPRPLLSTYRSEFTDPAAWVADDGAIYSDRPRASTLAALASHRDPRVRAAEKARMLAFQVRP